MATIPFISVEYRHSKYSNNPAHQSGNQNSNDDGHATTTHGRQDLTSNDTGQDGIASHEDDVEEGGQFSRPVSHDISGNDLFGTSAVFLGASAI